MRKFSWVFWLLFSMISIGVNMIRYSHDSAEVLRFTGGWLVTSGVAIPLIGWIFTPEEKKKVR